jgi:hypothetical protein
VLRRDVADLRPVVLRPVDLRVLLLREAALVPPRVLLLVVVAISTPQNLLK